MKIGLLMPARERINLNLTLISSIITTAKDINNINLYMGIDDDDPTREIQKKISDAIPFVKFIPIHNNGKFIGLGRIWNILANQCPDEIFGYLGNDMIFRTPNWDEIILNEFQTNCPEDKIQLIYCNDDHRPGDMCVNAFIHRRYMEVVGYFIREEFLINWSDRWLMQMFGAFNRLRYLSNVHIYHNHWVFGERKKDNTAERMGAADQGGISDKLWPSLAPERVKEIEKLSKYLKLQPDWSKVEI